MDTECLTSLKMAKFRMGTFIPKCIFCLLGISWEIFEIHTKQQTTIVLDITGHIGIKAGFHFNRIVTYRSIFFCVKPLVPL